ncbi:hypothetical protein GE061_006863 [Apolygus lucorum]|uniref:J domain-containing protein n=1 Tax=Apolygus lucorum TaxID=248454 RepID=A0A8S9WPJ1_APOLU|nr:hypothetical protein GE061_006863 [Apolygus lucorum]
MPGFLEACKKYFGSENLYEVLSIEKTATTEDIKKAYRKLSLVVHPDRVGDDEKEEATEKFKILSKIHATLSDKDKRSAYDDTGCVDDDDSLNNDWTEYWRLLFKKITDDDIRNYEAKYKGGDEEKTDLLKAYQKFDGDIDMILDHVPFSHPEDIPRFQEILRPMIDSKEIPYHKRFLNDNPKKQAARKRKYDLEAKHVKKIEKENERKQQQETEEMDVEASALNAIMLRKKEREAEFNGFLANLEAKYARPKRSSKSKAKRK